MIIFLNGEDTFRSRRQLKKMVEKFKKERDPQGFNVVFLDCQKENEQTVLQQMFLVPFLAEKRLIIIENLLSATKKQSLQEAILKKIEANNLPETNIVIFWEGEGKPKTDVSKKILNILKKEKFAQSFEPLLGPKLMAWIRQEFSERGGKISTKALEYLVANIGDDMWRLNSIIDQLISFKLDSEIEVADVELFLSEKVDDNIFNLIDLIIGKQTKKVYQMIQQQYKKGEDSQFILSMILRQIKILVQIRDLFEREDNSTSDQIAKKLGLHPFVVKKSLPLSKKYTLEELKNIYQKLLEIDIQTKTGQAGQSLLLDFFVGKLSLSN